MPTVATASRTGALQFTRDHAAARARPEVDLGGHEAEERPRESRRAAPSACVQGSRQFLDGSARRARFTE